MIDYAQATKLNRMISLTEVRLRSRTLTGDQRAWLRDCQAGLLRRWSKLTGKVAA